MQKQKRQKTSHPNNKHNLFARAAKTGDFTDIELTPETVRFYINDGNTFAHICALRGHLLAIPYELRTPELMALRNDAGQTVGDVFDEQRRKAEKREKEFADEARRRQEAKLARKVREQVRNTEKKENESADKARRRQEAKLARKQMREQMRRAEDRARRPNPSRKDGNRERERWTVAKADALVRKIFGLPEGSTEDPFEEKS